MSITGTNGICCLVIHGALVQVFHSVLLSYSGGRQLGHNHGKQRVCCVNPDLHGALHQWLASQGLVVTFESDAQCGHHLGVFLLVIIHDSPHELVDWRHDELTECPRQRLVTTLWLLHVSPCLLLSIEKGVTPQTLHHLFLVNAHLGGIDLGKTLNVEAPAMEPASKCNGSLLRRNLHISHQGIVVSGNDDVDILDGLAEARVHVLGFHLKFENATVNLVDKEARPNALCQRLSQNSFRLHSATLNAVHDNHCSVSDTESSRHFGREVDVAWRVNQVDQVRLWSLTIVFIVLEIQRDTSALNRHTPLLLICSGMSETSIAGGFS
mmetsp:Transcript_38449/g.84317  ORF Transcript_38449/g.84317 Transcript_38449/m.84317 type:complete len:324 (-) Transcript_38449:218-1189(-)